MDKIAQDTITRPTGDRKQSLILIRPHPVYRINPVHDAENPEKPTKQSARSTRHPE